MGPQGVGLHLAVGVGVACHIEPVPAPALAVGRRRQQSLDELLVGIGGGVVHEGVDLRWRWWKAGEIEAESPDQGFPIGVVGEAQSCGALSLQQERIEGRTDSVTFHHRRHRLIHDR